jgi:hypothetical protein
MALSEQLQELTPASHCNSILDIELTIKKVRKLIIIYGNLPKLADLTSSLHDRRNKVLFS